VIGSGLVDDDVDDEISVSMTVTVKNYFYDDNVSVSVTS
jgi:hypothetical protein